MFIGKTCGKTLSLLLVTTMLLLCSLNTLSYADELWRQKVTPDKWRYLMDEGSDSHFFRTDPSQFNWPESSYSNTETRPDNKALDKGGNVTVSFPEEVKWVCNNGVISTSTTKVIFDDAVKEQTNDIDKAKKVYFASGVVVAVNEDSVVKVSSNFDRGPTATGGRTFDYDRAIAIKNGIPINDSTKNNGEIKNKRRLNEKEKNPPNNNHTATNFPTEKNPNLNNNKNTDTQDNKNTNNNENTNTSDNKNTYIAADAVTTINSTTNSQTNTISVPLPKTLPEALPTDRNYIVASAKVTINQTTKVDPLPTTRPEPIPTDKNYIAANFNVNINKNTQVDPLPDSHPEPIPADKNYIATNVNININQNTNADALIGTQSDKISATTEGIVNGLASETELKKEAQELAKEDKTFFAKLLAALSNPTSEETLNVPEDKNLKYIAYNASVQTTTDSATKIDTTAAQDKPIIDDSDSLLKELFKLLQQYLQEILAFFTGYFQGDSMLNTMKNTLSE